MDEEEDCFGRRRQPAAVEDQSRESWVCLLLFADNVL